MIFILGLPRSRTKWLSEFLKTEDCKTSHEESFRHPSLESLYNSGFDVICDTGLIILCKKLDGLIILIDRPLEEVIESCNEIGLSTDILPELRKVFDEAKKYCICIPYEDLKKEAVCKLLFESVTNEKFDRDRWIEMDKNIIECDIGSIFKEVDNNKYNIEKLYGRR